MKVFSKDKYIESEGIEQYESGKDWIDQCEGLTAEQMLNLDYVVEAGWMVEKDDCSKTKNNKNQLDFKINIDDEGLEDTVDKLREVTDLIPNITIRNNEQVYVTINNFNTPAKDYYKED